MSKNRFQLELRPIPSGVWGGTPILLFAMNIPINRHNSLACCMCGVCVLVFGGWMDASG